MNNKGLAAGLVVAILVIGGGIWYHNSTKTSDSAAEQNTVGQGNVYVGVTDASADIKNIDDIALTLNKVELHSASQGWVTVASDPKTYKLLELKNNGQMSLYAQKALSAGHYDQVRVTLGDATVWTHANGQMKAVLPASAITINEDMNVGEGQNTSVKLDFLADKSLHLAKDNKYVFAAVVNSEARSSAQISVNGEAMNVSGGSLDSKTNVGVDLSGGSRANYALTTDNTLQVQNQSSGSLAGNVTFLLKGNTYLAGSASDQTSGQMNAGTSNSAADTVAGSATQGVTLGAQDAAGLPVNISGVVNTNLGGNAGTNTNGANGSGSLKVDTNGGVHLGY